MMKRFLSLSVLIAIFTFIGCTETIKEINQVNYIVPVWKGTFTIAPSNPEVGWAYYNKDMKKSFIYDGFSWQIMTLDGENGKDGTGITWKGELAIVPSNPQMNWAYYNTIDGNSYIYNGNSWDYLAKSGKNGTSSMLLWLGSHDSAPENPSDGWAYYNNNDRISYIYSNETWQILSKDGTNGSDGNSIVWQGVFSEAPESPEINWAYFNSSEQISYIWNGTSWDTLAVSSGTDTTVTIGITWLGTFDTAPSNPLIGYAYYNSTIRASYIYDGTVWQQISKDGVDGANGTSPTVTGYLITWKGSYSSTPSTPEVGWAYYDTNEKKSFIYDGSSWQIMTQDGIDGSYGQTITWLGSFITPPSNPEKYWAYFNTEDGCSYIYDGENWTLLAQAGKDGIDGEDGKNSNNENIFYGYYDIPLNSATVTIPDGVTVIGSSALAGFYNLESITIPDSVTYISDNAFRHCTKLTNITIPDSVTYIGHEAFYGCNNLKSVTVGNGVTSVGSYAFEDCNSLNSIYISDLELWNNINFCNNSNPLCYGANLYLNNNLVKFTVTFNVEGEIYHSETVISGEKVVRPDNPSGSGYPFYGWSISDEGDELNSTVYNFDTAITKNITINAKFLKGAIGDIVYSDGSVSENYDNTKKVIGIVIEVTGDAVKKIVSLTETKAKWRSMNKEFNTYADNKDNGVDNMLVGLFPASKWCDDYTDASGNSDWYLPAKDELNQLYTVKEYVNAAIDKIIAGGGTATKLSTEIYWSSTQYTYANGYGAYYLNFSNDAWGNTGATYYTYSVRAVRAF